jgi:alpha-amylase/alpha-mannosidase (GH57 family)
MSHNHQFYKIKDRMFTPAHREQYENGLNDRCEELSAKLIKKRNAQLQEVNEFVENLEPNSHQTGLGN